MRSSANGVLRGIENVHHGLISAKWVEDHFLRAFFPVLTPLAVSDFRKNNGLAVRQVCARFVAPFRTTGLQTVTGLVLS